MSLCTETQRTEQKLDACNAYFGERHCRIIDVSDDTAGNLNLNTVDLNAIDENYKEKKFRIVLSNNPSQPSPSVPSDVTLIRVEYTDNDTGAVIAGLIETAINNLSPKYFKVQLVGNSLHIRNLFLGGITNENKVGTAFTVNLGKKGFGGPLGAFADGGATLSIEVEREVITSDQTGTVALDRIYRGFTLSIEMTLSEMTQARWESLIGNVAGGIVEIGPSKLVGYGTGKLFKSEFSVAGMLVLHPIALPLNDRSSDYVFHKTAPDLTSINFSGTERQGAEFTFEALKDSSVNSAVDLFVKGDYTLL